MEMARDMTIKMGMGIGMEMGMGMGMIRTSKAVFVIQDEVEQIPLL